ncbi:MAG TPA: hypothetical protein DHV28_16455 [Ignavibacteriales bacterium]|nr:hypothetical protein [Ignavibacteriales bacterium]
MNSKERQAEEVMYQIFTLIGEDFDFRYNTSTGEIELDTNRKGIWKTTTDVFIGGIRNLLMMEGDVYNIDELRDIFKSAPSLKFEGIT